MNAGVTRRQFVKGVAAVSGVALLSSPDLLPASADNRASRTLKGNVFKLTIGEQRVNFTGAQRIATTINHSLPAPVLRFQEGELITLHVKNELKETSSIHWHGLILPSAMDGVPGISDNFAGIRPGQTFTYRFKAAQSGTYWYHSHSGFQEQTGMYGAIIIDPIEKPPIEHNKDYVVLLSDWTDEDPHTIYRKLKKYSHYYNFNERTHSDLMNDIEQKGLAATWNDRKMWNRMRMSQRDLSDVTGYTYTYLMNGQTPDHAWLGLFDKGDRLRLRFINASAMTFFDVRIPDLTMTVVAADGQRIQPVCVDEFRIGVAETYDVIVEPKDDTAYTIFAQDIARSGYARGTLSPDASLSAEVPTLDKVPDLSHDDMGMAHAEMAGMDHSKMGHAKMDHSKMDHAKMDHAAMAHKPSARGAMVAHADTEHGPHVDMLASNPQYRLDDPGVGLRDNGRRVLTYADLRNVHRTCSEPEREIELHLTGNMMRYMWSMNGVKFADAEPLKLKFGEVVRITLVNDTMMNHPIHLHGMWSDLETGDDAHIPRKHTVIVQPGAKISHQVKVDARGSWAYHCHLLYHMPGMFRRVDVV